MFFNLFNNKKNINNTEETDEILASVTYFVTKNSPSVHIDIELNDYDEKSASAICEIIDILSEDLSYFETINMLQNALIGDKQEDLLIKIFTNISQNARDKILKTKLDSKKDEPCIKPSDML